MRAGILIIESLNLEGLAADGVREFVFVCLPLEAARHAGLPIRPIARVKMSAAAARWNACVMRSKRVWTGGNIAGCVTA